MEELPFRTLLYRYFFFGWLFRHVDSNDMFERASVLRHNRRQAAWLPVYMMRWLWWGLLFYGVAGLLELVFDVPGIARWFYAASAMCIGFTVTIVTTWVGLTQRHEQL